MGSEVPPAPPVRTPPGSSGSESKPPSRAQQAAKASWLAPLIVIIFNAVLKNASLPPSRARALVIATVSLFFYLAGLGLAVYALSRVRAVGRKGVLAPALVGLVLNGLFLLLVGLVVVPNLKRGRATAPQQQSLLSRGAMRTTRLPDMRLQATRGPRIRPGRSSILNAQPLDADRKERDHG